MSNVREKTNKKTGKKILPLSLRMQEILDVLQQEVSAHGTIACVADVGCDHAFVSMACMERRLADHVIAMDVRKGPLSIADHNITEYGFEKSVETRLSNGFERLEIGEADWAIIAGMGGNLMRQILIDGESHLKHGIGLVLQPQSEQDAVRSYLQTSGYIIIDERFLVEDGKFYTIIKAKKDAENSNRKMDMAELLYGPVLIRKKDPLLLRFVELEVEKKKAIYETLKDQDTESARKRCVQLEHMLALLHIVKDRIV